MILFNGAVLETFDSFIHRSPNVSYYIVVLVKFRIEPYQVSAEWFTDIVESLQSHSHHSVNTS